jgi:hypothetical protein
MGHYKSNVRDLEFNLFEVFDRQEVLGQGIYADVDVDAAKDILHEVSRLAENELADSLLDGHPDRDDARVVQALVQGLRRR